MKRMGEEWWLTRRCLRHCLSATDIVCASREEPIPKPWARIVEATAACEKALLIIHRMRIKHVQKRSESWTWAKNAPQRDKPRSVTWQAAKRRCGTLTLYRRDEPPRSRLVRMEWEGGEAMAAASSVQRACHLRLLFYLRLSLGSLSLFQSLFPQGMTGHPFLHLLSPRQDRAPISSPSCSGPHKGGT